MLWCAERRGLPPLDAPLQRGGRLVDRGARRLRLHAGAAGRRRTSGCRLAHALAGGAFGAGVQHYYELRERAFSPAVAEAKYQALQSRIRPHFLFNSLNAVLAIIRTEPPRPNACSNLSPNCSAP